MFYRQIQEKERRQYNQVHHQEKYIKTETEVIKSSEKLCPPLRSRQPSHRHPPHETQSLGTNRLSHQYIPSVETHYRHQHERLAINQQHPFLEEELIDSEISPPLPVRHPKLVEVEIQG